MPDLIFRSAAANLSALIGSTTNTSNSLCFRDKTLETSNLITGFSSVCAAGKLSFNTINSAKVIEPDYIDLQRRRVGQIYPQSKIVAAPFISRYGRTRMEYIPWNEPPGFITMMDVKSFTSKPPMYASNIANPFFYAGRGNRTDLITDPTAPSGVGTSLQMTFPTSLGGGTSPDRLDMVFPRASPTPVEYYYSVYSRVVTKHSAGFTHNNNTGTKFLFWNAPGGVLNHIWGFYGAYGGGEMVPFLFLQGAYANESNERFRTRVSWPIGSSYNALGGVWRTYETLLESIADVGRSGRYRMWIDGVLGADYSIQWYNPTQGPVGFGGMRWEPTYGGGFNSPPFEMYQYLDSWYVSVKNRV